MVPARAAVNMISVEHRVWGDAGASPVHYYDRSDSFSLSGSMRNDDLSGVGYYASSSSGDWSVNAFREGDANYFTNLSTGSLVSIYQSPSYFYPQSPFPPFTDNMVDYPIHWNATVDVNPGHDYELIMFVGAHRGEGGHGSASLALTLAPEPGSTLLAGMAVLLACCRRQRPVAGVF